MEEINSIQHQMRQQEQTLKTRLMDLNKQQMEAYQ